MKVVKDMTKELKTIIKIIEEKAEKNWINEFYSINSKKELVQKIKKYDIDLTDELLEEVFKLLKDNSDKELSDEDLEDIAAGIAMK